MCLLTPFWQLWGCSSPPLESHHESTPKAKGGKGTWFSREDEQTGNILRCLRSYLGLQRCFDFTSSALNNTSMSLKQELTNGKLKHEQLFYSKILFRFHFVVLPFKCETDKFKQQSVLGGWVCRENGAKCSLPARSTERKQIDDANEASNALNFLKSFSPCPPAPRPGFCKVSTSTKLTSQH